MWSRLAVVAVILALVAAQLPAQEPVEEVIASPTPTPGAEAAPPQDSPEQQPESSAATVADAALLQLAGWQLEPAAATLDQHRERLAATPEYATALGVLRAAQGKPEEALGLLGQAATGNAADPAPEYYRGELLASQKKQADANRAWQAAADRAKAAAEAGSADAHAHYYHGAAMVRLKRSEEARVALDKARQAGFSPILVDYQTGLSLFGQSRWDAARQQLDAVVAADGKFAHAYYYRGLAWSKLGRKDLMINDLDQFLKLAPGAPDAPTAKTLLSAYSR